MELQLTKSKKRTRVNSLVYSSSWVEDNKIVQSIKKDRIKQLTNTLLLGIAQKDRDIFKNSCQGLMNKSKKIVL